MTENLFAKPSYLWLVLVGLTVIAVGMCEDASFGTYTALVIMLIAAAKARLVILHYMEATRAPGYWRFLYETWNFSAAAIIVIGHYVTLAKAAG